ncbi:DUF2846 domain-containing protein [Colwellia sp. Arc7-635]|uniref:DUF2846 domain-containing protein n=1 Tax=Colwellia sp. Arc7-635 TaxID=2497879 RepID=UPI0013DFD185|nr:DUF2846 domain-containing protein [Colwellia sp. Arc7-635]
MRVLFLIICTLIFSGCSASGERFNGFENTALNKSSLYIYRPSKFFQGGTWPTVFIDGQEKFSLKNSGYVFSQLEPGEHEIKIGSTSFLDNWIFGDVVGNIDTEKGKTYYLRFDIEFQDASSMGTVMSFSGAAGLIEVNKAQAESDLKILNSSM